LIIEGMATSSSLGGDELDRAAASWLMRSNLTLSPQTALIGVKSLREQNPVLGDDRLAIHTLGGYLGGYPMGV
jgi:hypothetical protein